MLCYWRCKTIHGDRLQEWPQEQETMIGRLQLDPHDEDKDGDGDGVDDEDGGAEAEVYNLVCHGDGVPQSVSFPLDCHFSKIVILHFVL